MNDGIGYLATSVTIGSYLFKSPTQLRRIQAIGALLWTLYGALIHSWPVIVANLLVMSMAIWSSFKVVPNLTPRPPSP